MDGTTQSTRSLDVLEILGDLGWGISPFLFCNEQLQNRIGKFLESPI